MALKSLNLNALYLCVTVSLELQAHKGPMKDTLVGVSILVKGRGWKTGEG